MKILAIGLHCIQRDKDNNNERSVNKHAGGLAPNNPGIFILKYDNQPIEAKEDKNGEICTHKIYDKDDDDGGNDYQ